MEKLIKQYVISITEMDQHQYANRAKRSCQDALLCLNRTVTHFIDQIPFYYARCLFLDFSSAFNTLNTSMIMPWIWISMSQIGSLVSCQIALKKYLLRLASVVHIGNRLKIGHCLMMSCMPHVLFAQFQLRI